MQMRNNRETNNKSWFIILGQNTDNYFDVNLTKEVQQNLVKLLKSMNWDKIYHNQEKHYIFEDMQYVIDNRNKHTCFKTKVLSYDLQTNALIGQLNLLHLPIDKFPPITEYHNMMLMEKSTFIKGQTQIHVRAVNHQDNSITYEIKIESTNKEEALEYAEKLGYKLNEFKPNYIDHGAYYVMSLI